MRGHCHCSGLKYLASVPQHCPLGECKLSTLQCMLTCVVSVTSSHHQRRAVSMGTAPTTAAQPCHEDRCNVRRQVPSHKRAVCNVPGSFTLPPVGQCKLVEGKLPQKQEPGAKAGLGKQASHVRQLGGCSALLQLQQQTAPARVRVAVLRTRYNRVAVPLG